MIAMPVCPFPDMPKGIDFLTDSTARSRDLFYLLDLDIVLPIPDSSTRGIQCSSG